ncbi:chromosome segregation protein SMC [Thermoleptolyngbya sp. M55_K2018_002]|uniref:chromosome segregation protein SMC n=1 Tax=Thermoleptolyngbya sp. M55_K2018_002 TaxID=2747808 RepID=UPI001A0C1E0B|nr:chromosome segregation protein SMC [Thermoleptolyngbya sp. M55_K2018_002]HIK40326.1 chromosome segregation protein SMC [Thermoleptolyngbya sp. M55_K2018_002]
MHVKRVELSHFKSFGGTTQVPLLPGFTVISGPNGSGKSNILDALLFALGLAGSKGMRAERLPDLVNQSVASRGRSTVEASVTVTFALDEEDIAAYQGDDDSLPSADLAFGEGNGPVDAALQNGYLNSNHGNHGNHGSGSPSNGSGKKPDASQLSVAPAMVPFNEWSVTRKLRVTQQGTYTSNYYINGQPCTLNELHEQLHRFRIYPEGYNVVLQGDVTSIISMNPRERREIIDELAGVAAFDRKISQAKDKLDAVKEREEKFRIVERELIEQRDRLAQDRLKAEKYKRLKAEFQSKSQWEVVLNWQSQQDQAQKLQQQIEEGDRALADTATQLTALATEIQQITAELERLNARVKALGEDEQLALQSTLATHEAELRQLQRQEQDLLTASRDTMSQIAQAQQALQEQMQMLEQASADQQRIETQEIAALQAARDRAQRALQASREQSSAIAEASEAWVQEQAALRRQMEELLNQIEPQRTEQARLQERVSQLRAKIQEQTEALGAIAQSLAEKQSEQSTVEAQRAEAETQVQRLAQALAEAEQDLRTQQDTQTRLLNEQRDKQRQLDRLEAQTQAMQEAQGTGASQVILSAGIDGVHGLVAQLGRVDSPYQLALEIAAGGRLGNLVVEDDRIAARCIDLLKQRRAGRATFLPMNKIRVPQFTEIPKGNRPDGFVDYAVNLIDCDRRFEDVFAYVFGSTVVFRTLEQARPHLGKYRIVTLDGELLETSGAMTGGSVSQRQGSLRFGTVQPGESAEAATLRDRLLEIDTILRRCEGAIAQGTEAVRTHTQALNEARQQQRAVQLQADQLQTQLAALVTQEGQLRTQLSQNRQELGPAEDRLQTLERDLPTQEAELQRQRQVLADLEQSQTHSEWQQIQATIRQQEAELGDRQLALRSAEQRVQDLEIQRQRLQEKIAQLNQRLHDLRTQQTTQMQQRSALGTQQTALSQTIAQTRAALDSLEASLASEKQQRDRTERLLRDRQTAQQQADWQRQKLQETQQTRRESLATLQAALEAKRAELPDPLPELPDPLPDLGELQHELRSLQRRIENMEPVNMLALEEYERTQERLEDLSQKLGTLDEERSELLLRIENFTTLRQRAFKEAFDAVNVNFQSIFAELSDGDGYLQLDDPNDPFGSGLNLVAHPKGKPVRRLASMSGGEKSLTALSFIFALQRYRPSPFYAFDEVDMFLDGANVERLSRMIKHQAQQAQFIVVSLRRPMIEAAQRTIGVTQARGAYTQVLGIDLQQNVSG